MRLAYLTPDRLSEEQRCLYDAIIGGQRSRGPKGGTLTNAEGGLIGPFNALLRSPPIGNAVHELGEAVRFASTLPPKLLEIATLVVGAEWKSQFEFWAHARFAKRDGVSDKVIDAIRQGEEPPFGPDEADQRAVWTFCRELHDRRRVSDATYRGVVLVVGERGAFELVMLQGYYTMVSMSLNTFEVPLPDGQTPPFAEP